MLAGDRYLHDLTLQTVLLGVTLFHASFCYNTLLVAPSSNLSEVNQPQESSFCDTGDIDNIDISVDRNFTISLNLNTNYWQGI